MERPWPAPESPAGTAATRTAWSAPAMPADPRGSAGIAGAATVVLDARDTVIGWSPAAGELFGLPAAEALGHPLSAVLDLPPDAAAGRRTGTARHRDGRPVEVVVTVCPLPGGGTAARVLVVEELGRSREADARLAMLQGLATRSPLGLAVYDTDLRLVWANKAHDHEVGRPLAEYRGRPAEELYPDGVFLGTGPRTLGEVMRRVVDTGEVFLDLHFLARQPSDPDTFHLWSCSYYRLQDAEGRVLGVCEDAFDITDRHEAQQGLALLAEAGRRLGATLDVAATARAVADVAVPRFASRVTVDVPRVVLEGGVPDLGPATSWVRVASLSHAPGLPDPVPEDAPVVHRPGSPQLRSLASGGRVNAEDTLVVPLRTGGAVLGLVTFVRTGSRRFFDSDAVALADELAARAALGIDNARRFTAESAAALALQRQLLPQHVPPQSAVDIAHRYLPADDVTGVGGDWFDVIPLSGARVGLVVGDVVGHGLQAAATMGRLRTTVEALATLDMAPDELLTRLDDLLNRVPAEDPGGTVQRAYAQTDVTTGATCLYAVYDPVTRRCTMARAGHLPPVIVHPDGSCLFPDLPAGPPLGLGGLPFESASFDVPVGSILALFTDGLVEARDRDIEVGLDTLCRVLGAGPAPLETLCDRVLAELRPGGTGADDTALLLVRTRELEARRVVAWDLPAEPEAAGRARELVAGQLGRWDLDDLAFTSQLVVSELVTNAVRYAEGPLQLRLIRDQALLCEVADTGHTSPHLRHSSVDDEGGRGLFIVAQLVQRWGTRYTPSGKTIWTEQAFPSGRGPL